MKYLFKYLYFNNYISNFFYTQNNVDKKAVLTDVK